jgi:hypothetical protein
MRALKWTHCFSSSLITPALCRQSAFMTIRAAEAASLIGKINSPSCAMDFNTRFSPTELVKQIKPSAKLRQLGDIRRNPPRLIACEQLGRRSPPRLILTYASFCPLDPSPQSRHPIARRTTVAGSGVATSRSDHLVGADDKRLRKSDTERFCCLQI